MHVFHVSLCGCIYIGCVYSVYSVLLFCHADNDNSEYWLYWSLYMKKNVYTMCLYNLYYIYILSVIYEETMLVWYKNHWEMKYIRNY